MTYKLPIFTITFLLLLATISKAQIIKLKDTDNKDIYINTIYVHELEQAGVKIFSLLNYKCRIYYLVPRGQYSYFRKIDVSTTCEQLLTTMNNTKDTTNDN